MVDGVEIVGVDGLDDVARLVAGPRGQVAGAARRRPALRVSGTGHDGDAGTTAVPGGSHLVTGLAPADLVGSVWAAHGALGTRGGPGGWP